VDTVST